MTTLRPCVYFDVSCLGRLVDDRTHPRILREAEAVARIFFSIDAAQTLWISSEVVRYELEQIGESRHRSRLMELHERANVVLNVTDRIESRADLLVGWGLHVMDALHVACAESRDVDAFLTTDDHILRTARRISSSLRVEIHNPVWWEQEYGL